jgi:hypothetical protein
LYIIRATTRVNITPTGTIIPTVPELRAGIVIKRASIRMTGAIASLTFLAINTTPRPPKSAGSIWAKAGVSTGDARTGVKGIIRITPNTIIAVVTMLDTAIEIVEIISPSSELALTFAFSIASRAQGSLRFEILPVTKERYAPPAPSMGTYVITSITPTAQYIGSTDKIARPKADHSGTALKIIDIVNGKAKIRAKSENPHILPSR